MKFSSDRDEYIMKRLPGGGADPSDMVVVLRSLGASESGFRGLMTALWHRKHPWHPQFGLIIIST